MTVYVDDMNASFGRMIMCHMIADTEDELHAMADKIGVARKWYQKDHYDISLSKRAEAVRLGAVEITFRDAGLMMMDRRRRRDPTAPLLTVAEAMERINARHAAKVAGEGRE